MRLVLASGSASRRTLLEQAGLTVEAIPSRLDEEAAKTALRTEGLSPTNQAMQLAELKAVKVSRQECGLVIGGDQMLACGSQTFDKPADMAEAARNLKKLQGRSHTLETAIVVCEEGVPVWRHMARPKLTMRTLSDADIERYLDEAGEAVLSTVGAYMLEGVGVRLFSQIEGDYFSILGLPLLPLLQYLRMRKAIAY